MKINIPNARIVALHASYEQATGMALPLNGAFKREYSWGAWLAHGWTENDLRLVIAYMRRNFKDYWLRMVRFSRLIEDHSYFEEYLAMARAERRNARPAQTERQAVLIAVGRTESDPAAPVKTAGKIANDVLEKGYQEIRERLKNI